MQAIAGAASDGAQETGLVDDELQAYKMEEAGPTSMDPIVYWRKMHSVYPHLAELARKYLAVPATSVPCERLFSVAGNTITEKRNRLSLETAAHLIFMHENKEWLNIH
jgi:zinc finger BED domain-containing protein 1 (E3 SUMO-protein ligase ZBED1)